MIKKVTDINSLSGVSSPLLPLIYGDFHYPFTNSDGAYIQLDDKENMSSALSLKNGSTTLVKTSSSVDLNELKTFFAFSGVTSVISDFPLGFSDEKAYTLLMCAPDEKNTKEVCSVTSKSSISEYKSIYGLLSENGMNFENWFPVFSKKINNGSATAVYKSVGGVPVSTAAATAIYNDAAIISGVYTSADFRKKGYASDCVNELLNRLFKSNVKKAYLWCEDKNISYYKKLGFISCGEVFVREEV